MNNPKCPYCGGEMKFSYGYDGYMNGHYWYRCDNCNALAPEANSPEEAYAAAMKRERARGEWTRINYEPCGHDYRCSVCGWLNDSATPFCPNCGAEMREEKDDE